MATHQQISGISDEDMVARMVNSYSDRFHADFWNYFLEKVDPHLPAEPLMVDMGCGPGLFLQELSSRYPTADIHGYDVTEAMLDYARALPCEGRQPVYHIHDIAEKPLPFSEDSVHMLGMTALLHVLDDPIEACREVARVLSSQGVFLLYDWVRTPLPKYLDRMGIDSDPEREDRIRKSLYSLFPVHNKFTVDDWHHVLREAGLKVLDHRHLASPHFSIFVCQSGR